MSGKMRANGEVNAIYENSFVLNDFASIKAKKRLL
jgi:hypothetical protein